VHLDAKLFGAYGLSEADRAIALNDLVLKSLEVMEYNERIGAKSGA
jgi:type II secretory pathway component PulC